MWRASRLTMRRVNVSTDAYLGSAVSTVLSSPLLAPEQVDRLSSRQVIVIQSWPEITARDIDNMGSTKRRSAGLEPNRVCGVQISKEGSRRSL